MEGMETRFPDQRPAEVPLTMGKLLKRDSLFMWSLSLVISATAGVISAELLKAKLAKTLPNYTGPRQHVLMVTGSSGGFFLNRIGQRNWMGGRIPECQA